MSDQAKICPNCRYPLQTMESDESTSAVMTTPETVRASKKRTSLILIVAVVLVAIGVCTGLVVKQSLTKKARMEYIENLSLARNYMLQGGAEAEGTCNLIKSVWYNTIFEKSDAATDQYTKSGSVSSKKSGKFNEDFNTSLSKLYESDEYKDKVITIKASQNLVEETMKKLQSPPDDLRDCYETLNDMYEAFTEFTKMAINPSGSLQTYSDDFASCDTTFMKCYDKLGTQIPEE